MTVACIAGMHRSGTSMVARMLNICGLYLGPPKDLGAPARDNPAGFWENTRLLEINERILAAFGGGWDIPPRFPDHWVDSHLLVEPREMALQLIGELGAHGTWGWKDPRTSLTLPFWRQLIPDLKVIVAIRNPVDIWRSLDTRGSSSFALSSHLTGRYLESLRLASQTSGRMVTHYDAIFDDPKGELRRLIGFLGLEADDRDLEHACKQMRPELRHTRSTLVDLLHLEASRKVIEEYLLLCREAGPRYQAVLAGELQDCFSPGEPSVDLVDWESVLMRSEASRPGAASVSAAGVTAAGVGDTSPDDDPRTQQPSETRQALAAQAAEKDRALLTMTAQLGAEKQAARALGARLADAYRDISDLTDALKEIRESRSWKVGQLFARVYRWFVPRKPADLD